MLDAETWKFINTFAPWFSALGTTAAVIVSLYLAARTSQEKLQITAGIYQIIREGDDPGPRPDYLQIRAVSVGFREVKVIGICWRSGFFKKQNYVQIPPRNALSAQLPAKLSYGDDASFMFSLAELRALQDPLLERVARSKWPKLAARFVKVGVHTSTGKLHLTRLSSDVREFMLRRWERAPH